jgi:hypothetical protein
MFSVEADTAAIVKGGGYGWRNFAIVTQGMTRKSTFLNALQFTGITLPVVRPDPRICKG